MKKIVTLLLATTALTACKQNAETSDKVMTEEQVKMIVDNYIEENPDKIFNEINNYMAKLQAEQIKKAFKIDSQTPIKGDSQSVITITTFSDFECPFCQRVNPTLDAILEKYQGKVKVAYKHLPLPFHAHSQSAALASIAANNQGKFWEFHDALFRNMQNLNQETYLKIAKKLNLDIDKFKADMQSDESKAKIAKDMQQAEMLQITGTPHFIINGEQLSGALPKEEFVKVIEKQLTELDK